eukprot:247903_1
MNPSGETYWEGMYWDGFSPEDMGAVPLEEVECLTDPIIQKALEKCRKLIAQDPDLSVTDFYVTMDEEMLLIDNDSVSEHTSSQAHGTPSQSDQTPNQIANQRSIQSDETPNQSDQTPNQTEDTVPSNQTNQTPNQIDQTPNQSDQIPNRTSNDPMPVLTGATPEFNVINVEGLPTIHLENVAELSQLPGIQALSLPVTGLDGLKSIIKRISPDLSDLLPENFDPENRALVPMRLLDHRGVPTEWSPGAQLRDAMLPNADGALSGPRRTPPKSEHPSDDDVQLLLSCSESPSGSSNSNSSSSPSLTPPAKPIKKGREGPTMRSIWEAEFEEDQARRERSEARLQALYKLYASTQSDMTGKSTHGDIQPLQSKIAFQPGPSQSSTAFTPNRWESIVPLKCVIKPEKTVKTEPKDNQSALTGVHTAVSSSSIIKSNISAVQPIVSTTQRTEFQSSAPFKSFPISQFNSAQMSKATQKCVDLQSFAESGSDSEMELSETKGIKSTDAAYQQSTACPVNDTDTQQILLKKSLQLHDIFRLNSVSPDLEMYLNSGPIGLKSDVHVKREQLFRTTAVSKTSTQSLREVLSIASEGIHSPIPCNSPVDDTPQSLAKRNLEQYIAGVAYSITAKQARLNMDESRINRQINHSIGGGAFQSEKPDVIDISEDGQLTKNMNLQGSGVGKEREVDVNMVPTSQGCVSEFDGKKDIQIPGESTPNEQMTERARPHSSSKVRRYDKSARKRVVQKWLRKKRRILSEDRTKVRYVKRKYFADIRPRIKGRFVSSSKRESRETNADLEERSFFDFLRYSTGSEKSEVKNE